MEYICPHCKKEFNSSRALNHHIYRCSNNPYKKIYSTQELTCKYCNKSFSTIGGLNYHIKFCINNSMSKLGSKYNIPNDELIKYAKNISKNCKTANDLNKIDHELFFVLSKKNLLTKVFNIQENKTEKYNTYTDNELIIYAKEIYKNNNIQYASGLGKIDRPLLNVLNKRNLINKVIPNKYEKINRYKQMSNSELIEYAKEIFKECKYSSDAIKIDKSLVSVLNKKQLLNKVLNNRYIKYKQYELMSNDELIKYAKTLFIHCNTVNKAIQIDNTLINILTKRDLINIVFSDSIYIKSKNYKKLSDNKLIKLGKEIFKGYDTPASAAGIDNALLYALKSRNLLNIVFNKFRYKYISPEQKKEYKENILYLIEKYDLISMDWAVIMDLIGENKLPKDFYSICKFGENTEERKKAIEALKEKYNIDVESESESPEYEDNSIEEEVNNIDNDIYNDEYNNEENNLKVYKETECISQGFNDDEIYSTGDKYKHIYNKQMTKLWNLVLKDNENKSIKNIDIIKSKVNDSSITPFAKHIYEEFLNMYNEVINFKVK